MANHKRALTGWMIALINLCAISNIKNFPLLAEYGLSIVIFLALAAIFFFLPASFIAAELASAWPERGVYSWVTIALGPRFGFLAIWFQWISTVIYYPTLLSFIVTTFAYIFDPKLAQNKIYVLVTILITFWTVTFVNFLGMRVSGWVSSITALFGTIIPIVLIIFMGGAWILSGHPLQITLSWSAIFPDLTSINQLVLLSGILLGLCGIEMSAVHAKDVRNPKKDYLQGIFFSALLILIFSVLGALSISAVVPAEKILLASGGMEAFTSLFETYHMPWAIPIIAAITTFGALGMLSTWVVGPSRGLFAAAENGDIAPLFKRANRHGMPVAILIIQALIVTATSSIFLFMPSVNSSYWTLVALSSMLYMLMYILMFIAAVRLRYKHPEVPREYKIPFGNIGIWVLSILGILGSSFGFFIGFLPPAQVDTGKIVPLECFLVGGILLFSIFPILCYRSKK